MSGETDTERGEHGGKFRDEYPAHSGDTRGITRTHRTAATECGDRRGLCALDGRGK